jgi:hypothetical protein
MAKRITAAELAAMNHDELATVGTKRRVMAALRKPKTAKKKPPPEDLSPRDRLRRAHAKDDGLATRQARRGEIDEKGATDGD